MSADVYLYFPADRAQARCMALELHLSSLAMFVFASSITPGPNNLLLMRSGARFGFAPTGPHIAGIAIGMVGLALLAHLGVAALVLAVPGALALLRWACFAYLLWLAWRVLRDAGPLPGTEQRGRDEPMSAPGAAAFQLVNPKAWGMVITAVTAFSTAGSLSVIALIAVMATLVCIGVPSMGVWAVWGAALHGWLQQPGARRTFNIAMAVLVAASAVLMLRTN